MPKGSLLLQRTWKPYWIGWLFLILLLYSERHAEAQTAADASSLIPAIDIGTILPSAAMESIIKTIAGLTSHHSWNGGASGGTFGFDIGIEAMAMKLPSDFGSAIGSIGGGSGGSSMSNDSLPAIPIPKLRLGKGFLDAWEIEASGIWYRSAFFLGGSLKWNFFNPDEGPNFGVRIAYSRTNLDFSGIGIPGFDGGFPLNVGGINLGTINMIIKTQTVSAAAILSKKLWFADPWMVAGFEYHVGQIEIPIKLTILDATQTLTSPGYTSQSYFLGTGVSFRFVPVPLTLAFGGFFHGAGMHVIGATFGIGF